MAGGRVMLLGDSILDNASYTRPEPDTAAHLRRILGDGWQVDLLAEDGATMSRVPAQVARLGDGRGTAVLSIGGNDVTRHISLLERRGVSSAEIFGELLAIAEDFARSYEAAATLVAGRAERTVLCTIYEVPLQPEPLNELVRVPLAVLNDRIIRVAGALAVDVLELRSVCNEAADFVLQIEPSARGAAKLAQAIAQVVLDDGSASAGRLLGG